MKITTLAFLITLLYSCSSDKKTESDRITKLTTEQEKPTESTIPNKIKEDDCVFDTSTYKFTSEAIFKFNPDLKFHWDDKEKEAIIKMENGDSLILHIGGCNHFSYFAKYRTDSSKFNDETYLLEKTRWIAKSFFDNEFENFDKYISNKNYKLETDEPHLRSYSIDIDTTITQVNEIYDGFSFRKVDGRTEIWMLGYIN